MRGDLALRAPPAPAAGGSAGAGPLAWRVAVLVALFALLHTLLEHPALDAPLFALNVATAEAARTWLALVGVVLAREGTLLLHAQGFATEVHQVCTALLPGVLLAAGIAMHWHGRAGARLLGLLAGVAVVVLVNQCRLVAVVWVGVQAPALFGVVHGWLAPAALVALTTAYGWAWARAVRPKLPPWRSSSPL
jgi:exosortase/archaeosortase family protein